MQGEHNTQTGPREGMKGGGLDRESGVGMDKAASVCIGQSNAKCIYYMKAAHIMRETQHVTGYDPLPSHP